MELRKIFDTIPEQFDTYRPRYSQALFDSLIAYAEIGKGKTVLELGPGTGQATEPVLKTGCDYHAIELGENLCAMMRKKYGTYENFHIIQGDFIAHDFARQQFDLIYSAATIQWIPEEIAFSKTFELLKPGGTLAMFLTRSDYKTPNEALYHQIQQVYSAYFKPETAYQQGDFRYEKASDWGYAAVEKREFPGKRTLTAEEYAAYCGTHCDHMLIPEPDKSLFFKGLKDAVMEHGNRIVFHDMYVLYLTKKPG